MIGEQADAHWLWQESINRLESLRLRVCEGRDLDAALEFARFFLWCRLDKILAPYENKGPLKVDCAFLRWKAEDLQRMVQDQYTHGSVPQGNQSTMQAVLHRLDMIAAHVAKISPPVSQETANAEPAGPVLQVIKGGV